MLHVIFMVVLNDIFLFLLIVVCLAEVQRIFRHLGEHSVLLTSSHSYDVCVRCSDRQQSSLAHIPGELS